MGNNRQTGTAHEEKAAAWLETQGMRILERNYRCRQGEIDLIAMDGRYLVFVEVKYRRDMQAGHPAEAVDVRKQRRISRAAARYLMERGISQEQPCRFDVVAVLGDRTEHIKDAFGL